MSSVRFDQQEKQDLAIAMFDLDELTWARSHMGSLADWEGLEDNLIEREGAFVGMTSAGLKVNIVEISLCGFISWSLHSNRIPCGEQLDEFAAFVQSFRSSGSIDVSAANVNFGRRGGDRNNGADFIDCRVQHGDGTFDFSVSKQLYSEWAESLRAVQALSMTSASIETYAGLLIQFWAAATSDYRHFK